VCFRKPVDQAAFEEVKGLLESVSEVVREGCGYAWDGVCLAVAMPQAIKPSLEMGMEEWEDVCQGFGFEFVDGEGRGRNEFSGEFTFSLWGDGVGTRADKSGRAGGNREVEGGVGGQ